MIANSVVLPAPFGPTSATICPSTASIEAWSSASSPPKRREMVSTRSRSPMRALFPAEEAAQARAETHDAARCKRNHEDEHAAVDDEIEARRVAGRKLREFAERTHHECAEQ